MEPVRVGIGEQTRQPIVANAQRDETATALVSRKDRLIMALANRPVLMGFVR